MKTKKQIEHRYSGAKSKRFWKIVNSLSEADQQELHSLSVMLQNMEEFVLNRLQDCRKGSVKRWKI